MVVEGTFSEHHMPVQVQAVRLRDLAETARVPFLSGVTGGAPSRKHHPACSTVPTVPPAQALFGLHQVPALRITPPSFVTLLLAAVCAFRAGFDLGFGAPLTASLRQASLPEQFGGGAKRQILRAR